MHVVLRLNTCKFKIKFWVVWFHTTSQSHAPGRPIRSEHTEPSLSPGAQAQLWVSGCGLAGGTWPIHSQGGKLAKSFISWPKWTGARAMRVGEIPAPALRWIGALSISTGELLNLPSLRRGVHFCISGPLPNLHIYDSESEEQSLTPGEGQQSVGTGRPAGPVWSTPWRMAGPVVNVGGSLGQMMSLIF